MVLKLVLLVLLALTPNVFAAQGTSVPSIGFGQAGTNGPAPMMYITPYQMTGTAENGIFTLWYGNVAASIGNGSYEHLYKNGVEYFVPTGTTTHCFNIVISAPSGDGSQLVLAKAEFANGANPIASGSLYQCGAPGLYCMNGLNNWSPQPGGFDFVGPGWPGVSAAGAFAEAFSMQCFEK